MLVLAPLRLPIPTVQGIASVVCGARDNHNQPEAQWASIVPFFCRLFMELTSLGEAFQGSLLFISAREDRTKTEESEETSHFAYLYEGSARTPGFA